MPAAPAKKKKTSEDRCEVEEGICKSDNSNLSRTNSLLNQRLRDDDIECILQMCVN